MDTIPDLLDELVTHLRRAFEEALAQAGVSDETREAIQQALIEKLHYDPICAAHHSNIWHDVDESIKH